MPMDGWPGWKAVPKTAEELTATREEIVAHDVHWSPSLGRGLAIGLAAGVALYVGIINILPWLGRVVTIVD